MWRINEIWNKIREKFLEKNKNTRKKILVEWLKKSYENRFWWTENYIQIELDDKFCEKNWLKKEDLKKWEIIKVNI